MTEFEKGKNAAIQEFIDKMKKFYWDSELQSVKDDPCIVDAMIDLSIRTAKSVIGE